jgi:hypothetical protein
LHIGDAFLVAPSITNEKIKNICSSIETTGAYNIKHVTAVVVVVS